MINYKLFSIYIYIYIYRIDMDEIIKLERLLKQYFKIINEAVDDATKQQLPQPQQQQPPQPAAPKIIRFIGAGGFGCVFSPPTTLTPIVKQEYPDPDIKEIDIETYDDKYIAKILNCKEYSYKKELEKHQIIMKIDPTHQYTPKMIFAGYMDRQALMNSIEEKKQTNIDLYNCLNDKLRSDTNKFYGYIIYNKVGKSLDKLEKNDINKSNIKEVLINFSAGIRDFINNLYNENLTHGDIKTPNMTLKNNKIYFIDFGLTHKSSNLDEVLNYSINYNYPIILHLFRVIYNSIDNKKYKKEFYLDYIDNDKYLKKSFILDYLDYHMKTLISQHQFSIFKNIEEVKTYFKTYIKQLLIKLDDNNKYTKEEVYKLCFSEIAKNIDIYSLSLALYHLFFNNLYKDLSLSNLVTSETLQLISTLFRDALYNTIKNPIELANRLDNIIKTIK